MPRSLSLEVFVEKVNREDISTYFQNVISSEHAEEDSSSDLTAEWYTLAEDVIDKASGVFQRVTIVVSKINKLRREEESFSYIKEKLAEVPKGLEEIYKHIIENIIEFQNRPRATLMMQ